MMPDVVFVVLLAAVAVDVVVVAAAAYIDHWSSSIVGVVHVGVVVAWMSVDQ